MERGKTSFFDFRHRVPSEKEDTKHHGKSKNDTILPLTHHLGNLKSRLLKSRPTTLTLVGSILFVILIFLSLFTRLFRNHDPDAVIFDEVYFGNFARLYLTRSFYFDIHPPLAKMLLGLVGWWSGLDPDFDWKTIGLQFPANNTAYVSLRNLQGFFGGLLPPLGFLTLLELGSSEEAAFLGGFLILLDLSFQTISRAVLTDSTLYFFIALSFLLYQKFLTVTQYSNPKSRLISDVSEQYFYCILTGISLGCAMCVKWTGVGVFAVVGVYHFITFVIQILTSLRAVNFRITQLKIPWFTFFTGILLIIISATTYVLLFMLHLFLINNWSDTVNVMPYEYIKSLKSKYVPNPPKISWIYSFSIMHKIMFLTNAASDIPHPWGSNFYEWPIMYRGLVYYWKDLPDNTHRIIYLFGNPFVWWLAFACIILFGAYLTYLLYRTKDSTRKDIRHASLGGTLFFAYFVNIFPYIWISRTVFVYHYHPSLYFGILLTGFMIDVFVTNPRIRKVIVVGILLIALGFYLYFLPFSFGIPLTSDQHKARIWLPPW